MALAFKFPSGKKEASRTARVGAYTLMDLLVGIVFLGFLAAVLLPAFARPHGFNCRIRCTNNLKQVGLSFKQWALDQQDRYPMQVPVAQGGTMELVTNGQAWVHFMVLSNELNTPKVLFCPEEKGQGKIVANSFGGTGFAGQILFTNDSRLSYFVGVDANDANAPTWLTGDANMAMNKKPVSPGLFLLSTNDPIAWNEPRHENGNRGYLTFADGHVCSATSVELGRLLKATGVATNRLAMP